MAVYEVFLIIGDSIVRLTNSQASFLPERLLRWKNNSLMWPIFLKLRLMQEFHYTCYMMHALLSYQLMFIIIINLTY